MIVALLTAITSSAHAAETLIDFEDDAFKTVLKEGIDSFSYENVTFSGIGRDSSTPALFSFSNKNILVTLDTSGYFLQTGVQNFETLQLSFTTDVNDFSFNFGGTNNDWELTAFDQSDTEIDRLLINSLENNGGNTFGISSGLTNISYATLTNLGDPFFGNLEAVASVDNLKYSTTSPIPEPSTYALMLGGLGFVGFMAARRRNKKIA